MSERPGYSEELIRNFGLISSKAREIFSGVTQTLLVQYPHPLVSRFYFKPGEIPQELSGHDNTVRVRAEMLFLMGKLKESGVNVVVFEKPYIRVLPPDPKLFPELQKATNYIFGKNEVGSRPKLMTEYLKLTGLSQEKALELFRTVPLELIFAHGSNQSSYMLVSEIPDIIQVKETLIGGRHKRREIKMVPSNDALTFDTQRNVVDQIEDSSELSGYLQKVKDDQMAAAEEEMRAVCQDLLDFFNIKDK